MRINWPRLALIVGAVVLVVISIASWSGRPVTTDSVISALVVGISLGSIYAIAASGIVVTYTTSGIFNFAQGAIGMFMAFVYWQLRVDWHLPAPIALILAVFVIAPLIGATIERVLMRHLVDSTLVVQLVVTVGLMLFFMGLTVLVWDPAEGRSINFFFGTEGFEIGDTFVLWHRFITILVAIGIALFLRLLLYRSRIGVTMRAVVDNRTLAGLHGARPTRASMLAWALGSSMAAISGILLVPELGLQVEALTFLIINAFAAAIVGRLKSLPLTYVGAMVLGLLVSFQQSYLDWGGRWSTASFAIPTIFLFVALLALPQARIELRKPPPPSKILQPRVSKVWETAIGMAALWLVVFFFTRNMGTVNLNRVTLAIVTALAHAVARPADRAGRDRCRSPRSRSPASARSPCSSGPVRAARGASCSPHCWRCRSACSSRSRPSACRASTSRWPRSRSRSWPRSSSSTNRRSSARARATRSGASSCSGTSSPTSVSTCSCARRSSGSWPSE